MDLRLLGIITYKDRKKGGRMVRNKSGKEICCSCGYKWYTNSKLAKVCCPNCLKKVNTNESINKKEK